MAQYFNLTDKNGDNITNHAPGLRVLPPMDTVFYIKKETAEKWKNKLKILNQRPRRQDAVVWYDTEKPFDPYWFYDLLPPKPVKVQCGVEEKLFCRLCDLEIA
jgi:hypothetical protein